MTIVLVVGGAVLGSLATMGILWYSAIRYFERNL